MKNTKKSISLLLLVSMLASIAACGEATQSTDTTVPQDSTTPQSAEAEYQFAEADFGGNDFTILNTAQTYGFYSTLDIEEQNGDTLDDAIFVRNSAIEERYNLNIVVNEEYQLEKAPAALATAVMAGDNAYDCAILNPQWMTNLVVSGYLAAIDDIPNLHIDEPWWDGSVTDGSRIGKNGKAYIAQSEISLVDFEGTYISYFNMDMLEDLGVEAPFQLVRDGKWTIDEYKKLYKLGTDLNGAEDFSLKPDSTCIYGISGSNAVCYGLLVGAGLNYIEKDDDGIPVIGINNERFYDLATLVSNMCAVEGDFVYANSTGDDRTHYEQLFKQGRALTTIAELKATNKYRDMEYEFGIAPIPKYDENQESYHNLRQFSYVFCAPITNNKLAETGAVIDAMAYLTYKDVVPAYYEGKLMSKSLRNDESVEMMELIRNTRFYDFGMLYGWSNTLRVAYSGVVNAKSTDFASKLAAVFPQVEASIEETLELLDK